MYGMQVVQIDAMHLGQKNMKVVLELVQFWKQMVITTRSIFTRLPYMDAKTGPHLCGGPLSFIIIHVPSFLWPLKT